MRLTRRQRRRGWAAAEAAALRVALTFGCHGDARARRPRRAPLHRETRARGSSAAPVSSAALARVSGKLARAPRGGALGKCPLTRRSLLLALALAHSLPVRPAAMHDLHSQLTSTRREAGGISSRLRARARQSSGGSAGPPLASLAAVVRAAVAAAADKSGRRCRTRTVRADDVWRAAFAHSVQQGSNQSAPHVCTSHAVRRRCIHQRHIHQTPNSGIHSSQAPAVPLQLCGVSASGGASSSSSAPSSLSHASEVASHQPSRRPPSCWRMVRR